jgi:hypothetical protein
VPVVVVAVRVGVVVVVSDVHGFVLFVGAACCEGKFLDEVFVLEDEAEKDAAGSDILLSERFF